MMKQKLIFLLFLFSGFAASAQNPDTSSVNYSDFFSDKSLRFDFNLGGDRNSETVYAVQLKLEPFWSGRKDKLTDSFNYGTFRIVLRDSASGKIIFTKGFSNLYQEWQGTPEARHLKRTYYQVVRTPFPKKSVILSIEKRGFADGLFSPLFTINVNPEDYFINKEKPIFLKSEKFRDSGDPALKADIVFLAEGYKKDEMKKFREDAERLGNELLEMKPYSEQKKRFNFWLVESISDENGVDIPADSVYVNTAMNSTFYTFDSERYLTTADLKSVYDAAANVPYDAIIILANSKKYGGGGFFNQYAESTVDNDYSVQVMIHEFGHSFAGLADEYVGDVNYSDFYNTKVEPWEPNITTNVNFESKWKHLIKEGTPVPTPRKKEFEKTIGMFEGGGYMSEGIYSPMMDCRMKTNEAPGFCGACEEAITKMIMFYSE